MVDAPARHVCYSAAEGLGTWKYEADQADRQLHVRTDSGGKPVVAVSLSHTGKTTEDFLAKFGPHSLVRRGSVIKCCLIAKG